MARFLAAATSIRSRRCPPRKILGYVTEKIPGMFIFLGAGAPENAPLHSPQMVLDEDVLPLGAALHANVAISWLNTHSDSR